MGDPEGPRRAQLQALAARALHDLAAAQSALLVFLGDRLGLYRALRGAGPLDATELARRSGLDPRYVAEWLANQAASGWVDYDAETGRFELSPEQAALFADESSPAFQGGAYQLCAGLFAAAPALESAFRESRGLASEEFGPLARDAVRRLSRNRIAAELDGWVGAMPGLREALERGERVAEVGCGAGETSLRLARCFPEALVLGVDVDASAVALAREAAMGLGERVRFEVGDASALEAEAYALVLFVDVLHEVPEPEPALADARRALADGGRLLLVEPHAGEGLAESLHPGGRLLSAVSTAWCLPSSRRAGEGAMGALTSAAAIRGMIERVGFRHSETLPSRPFELALACRP